MTLLRGVPYRFEMRAEDRQRCDSANQVLRLALNTALPELVNTDLYERVYNTVCNILPNYSSVKVEDILEELPPDQVIITTTNGSIMLGFRIDPLITIMVIIGKLPLILDNGQSTVKTNRMRFTHKTEIPTMDTLPKVTVCIRRKSIKSSLKGLK